MTCKPNQLGARRPAPPEIRTGNVSNASRDALLSSDAEKVEGRSRLAPNLVAGGEARMWTWAQPDTWQPLEGGASFMTVDEMAFAADHEGNWFLRYRANVHQARHKWMYGLEARTAHDTPLFTLVPTGMSRMAGSSWIVQAGRLADLRRDWAHVTRFLRVSIGGRG